MLYLYFMRRDISKNYKIPWMWWYILNNKCLICMYFTILPSKKLYYLYL